MSEHFWETRKLDELSTDEWESLCDGCARCCLLKLEDEDTGELHFTNVSCHLLDIKACRCRDYPHRLERVPDCLQVRDMSLEQYGWLPESCAYRRLAEGRGLADWHPLISGDANSVREAGISIAGFAVNEENVHPQQLELHIIELTKC